MKRRSIAALAAVLALAASSAGARPSAPLQHVTLIGDSVADALLHDPKAPAMLGIGVDLDLEVAPCRRVETESCPFNGARPQTVVDLVRSKGSRLGPTVIVSVGYNDPEDDYAQSIEAALQAMRRAGIEHVLWATLRAARHPYVRMNGDIAAAAARHPEMRVVDWNLFSRSHPEWFEDDGIHLYGGGAQAMASLFHKSLIRLGIAPRRVLVKTRRLPVARRGRAYAARLVAAGGTRPYRWSARRLPSGLELRPNGRLLGRPRAHAGFFVVEVRVADSAHDSARKRLSLRVRR